VTTAASAVNVQEKLETTQPTTSGREVTSPGNPVVVVKHVQTPKSYNGKTSWKQYKKILHSRS